MSHGSFSSQYLNISRVSRTTSILLASPLILLAMHFSGLSEIIDYQQSRMSVCIKHSIATKHSWHRGNYQRHPCYIIDSNYGPTQNITRPLSQHSRSLQVRKQHTQRRIAQNHFSHVSQLYALIIHTIHVCTMKMQGKCFLAIPQPITWLCSRKNDSAFLLWLLFAKGSCYAHGGKLYIALLLKN